LHFLNANRQRLDLAAYGLGGRMSAVVLTPRFRASAHVVVLVLAEGNPEPVLVGKAPRLADGGVSLQREASSLRCIQKLFPRTSETVPRVIAFEPHFDRPILVETALVGRPMDPPHVRRDLGGCCQAALRWLVDVHGSPDDQDDDRVERFERLVTGPLDYLAGTVPWSREERRLLDQTRELVEPLREARLPAVLEHGDFSHPTLMLLDNGRVGVVDWEMADLDGLPCHDLVFFLTYAAFARENARENNRYLPAIQRSSRKTPGRGATCSSTRRNFSCTRKPWRPCSCCAG
jgi:aminoglycoside phosphotransferase (APT) family kinase protein